MVSLSPLPFIIIPFSLSLSGSRHMRKFVLDCNQTEAVISTRLLAPQLHRDVNQTARLGAIDGAAAHKYLLNERHEKKSCRRNDPPSQASGEP